MLTLPTITVSAEALLFDLDGVLVDSLAVVEKVWRAWAVENGFDPDHVMARVHGRPSLATVREFLPGSDHEAENSRVEGLELAEAAGIEALPGARELLVSLPPPRWAIVTSCMRPLAEARARAGGLPFPRCFVTASDIRYGKPHPEPYLTAAAALGFDARDCIVVEDVAAGVRAGKAAGARVIGIASGEAAAELARLGADWVVADCAAIVAEAATEGLRIHLRC